MSAGTGRPPDPGNGDAPGRQTEGALAELLATGRDARTSSINRRAVDSWQDPEWEAFATGYRLGFEQGLAA